jgi:hypothetical protein
VVDVAGALEDLIGEVDTAFYKEFRPTKANKSRAWLPLAGLLLVRNDDS